MLIFRMLADAHISMPMLIFRAWATRDVHGKQPMIIKVVDNRASVGQKQKYEHHAINAQTRDIHLHVYK